jgi:Xaa-Pro aminopeptidase
LPRTITAHAAQKAIREEDLDGWLFYNFSHRDGLTDELLGLDRLGVSTRPWYYVIPSKGECLKIVSSLEPHALDSLPGMVLNYDGFNSLSGIFRRFSGCNIAALYDPYLPTLSTLPASQKDILADAGINVVSASNLLTSLIASLTKADFQSHERAARALYAIAEECWQVLRNSIAEGKTATESDITELILGAFERVGLITSSRPIVAFGPNSGDPHYELTGRGRELQIGDVIQLDLWAKERDGIYADISQAGYYGPGIPPGVSEAFKAVTDARDAAIDALTSHFGEGSPISGADIDALTRSILSSRGFTGWIRHRTGHGIDTDCHGSGVNLDSIEFPDSRLIREGSLFSVEPGVYCNDFGFRSEVNVYVLGNKPIVSGTREPQRSLIHLEGVI